MGQGPGLSLKEVPNFNTERSGRGGRQTETEIGVIGVKTEEHEGHE